MRPGYYTAGGYEGTLGHPENTTRVNELPCTEGHFCEGGIIYQCPAGTYGADRELNNSNCNGPCAPGHFCPPGSTSPTQYQCGEYFLNVSQALQYGSSHIDSGAAIGGGASGAGATGANQDITDPELLLPWSSGTRVKRPSMDLLLDSPAAIHKFILEGGPASVYCAEGSAFPKPVVPGFYSIGDHEDWSGNATEGADVLGGPESANMTRSAQRPCEPGSFCTAGRRYNCPPGTYGSQPRLTSRYCTAWCPAGYYCPTGSASPIECPDNTYSPGGYASCAECPSPPLEAAYRAINAHAQANGGDDSVPQHIAQRCKTDRSCCNY